MLQSLSKLGLALALSCAGAAALAAESQPSVQVQTVTVQRHTLQETVTAFGRVQPDADHVSSVTLPRAGLVSRLWVRLGQRVQAGAPLLELDTAPTARMDYQQALAAVDFARSDLARLEALFSQQLATRDQVAAARRSLKDTEAKLAAQRALGMNRVRETLRAPFDGIVTQLDVKLGQRVQADTTAMLLASRDALVIPLGLEQDDALRVHPGMPVVLDALFGADGKLGATVSQVHAMVDPKTRLVDVLVRVPKGKAQTLMLDGIMRGTIVLRQVDALTVPRSAVLRDERGAYVFVVRSAHARRVEVTTGLEQAGEIEILTGLQAGASVVSVGNYELQDGMAVREVRQ